MKIYIITRNSKKCSHGIDILEHIIKIPWELVILKLLLICLRFSIRLYVHIALININFVCILIFGLTQWAICVILYPAISSRFKNWQYAVYKMNGFLNYIIIGNSCIFYCSKYNSLLDSFNHELLGCVLHMLCSGQQMSEKRRFLRQEVRRIYDSRVVYTIELRRPNLVFTVRKTRRPHLQFLEIRPQQHLCEAS